MIHRDLKPENVALGEFGEVVVLDWGLAKVKGDPEGAADPWAKRLEEYRQAADLKTVAGALGTPGYMAPEAIKGQAQEVDEQSDVYSLGALLFQILTGRLPFTFATWVELAIKVLREDAPTVASIDAAVPMALSDLCARCLAREKAERPADAAALAHALRAWQAQSAADREAERMLEQARTALAAAKDLQGAERLKQIDRAALAAQRVLDQRADAPEARALLVEVEGLRETGTRERESAARRRALRRAGVLALGLALVASAGVAWLLEGRRRETAEARTKTVAERDAKDAALTRAEGLRLAAQAVVVAREDPELALWLAARAGERVQGLEANTAALAALDDSRRTHEFRHDFTPNPSIRIVRFSPDGRRLLTSGNVTCIWDLATGRREAAIPGEIREGEHGRRNLKTGGVSWETDTIWASERGGTGVWTTRGERIAHLEDPVLYPRSTRSGPRGLVERDEGWAVVDARTGDVLSSLAGAPDALLYPTFTDDGAVVLAALSGEGGKGWKFSAWSARDGRSLASVVSSSEEESWDWHDIHPGADGHSVRILSSAGILTWDAWTGEVARSDRFSEDVDAGWFAPDGEWAVGRSGKNLWTVGVGTTGARDPLSGQDGLPDSAQGVSAFSADGGTLACSLGSRRALGILDLGTRTLRTLVQGIGGDVEEVALDPRGDTLVVAREGGSATVHDVRPRVWRDLWSKERGAVVGSARYGGHALRLARPVATGVEVTDLRTQTTLATLPVERAEAFEWSSDGRVLGIVHGQAEHGLHPYSVWDVAGARRLLQVKTVFSRDGWMPRWSEGGGRVLTLGRGEREGVDRATVWDVQGGRPLIHLEIPRGKGGHPGWRELSPDGRYVLAWADDKVVLRSVDRPLEPESPFAVPRYGWGRLGSRFSPCGRWLVFSSTGEAGVLWDLARRAVVRPSQDVASWAPDGEAYLDVTGAVRRTASGEELLRVGHWVPTPWFSTFGRFSSDGRWLLVLAGPRQRDVELWSLAERHRVRSLLGHRDQVRDAHFTSDGRRVITSSQDGAIRVWNTATGALELLRQKDAPTWAYPSGDSITEAWGDNLALCPLDPVAVVRARDAALPWPEGWRTYLPGGVPPVEQRAREAFAACARRSILRAELPAALEALAPLEAEVRARAERLFQEFVESPDAVAEALSAAMLARSGKAIPGDWAWARDLAKDADPARLRSWADWDADRDPKDEEPLIYLGQVCYRTDDFAGTLAALDRAQALIPDQEHVQVLNFRAMALWKLGRQDEARALVPRLDALAKQLGWDAAEFAEVHALVR